MTSDCLITPQGEYITTVDMVLSALDRWNARNDGHHTEKRTTRRFPFRGIVRITAAYSGQVVHFEAPTRDISVNGMCFLVARRIRTDLLGQNIIPAGALLTLGARIVTSLNRDGHNILLVSEIRRLRRVHDNLYECGVQFVARDTEGPSEVREAAVDCPN